jgi:transcriptional regulator with XRE-family HTH domain
LDERKVKVMMALRGVGSQKELAEKSGVHQDTLVQLLRGRRSFSPETLEKLAQALDCNPLDLLTTEGFPPPHLAAPVVSMSY